MRIRPPPVVLAILLALLAGCNTGVGAEFTQTEITKTTSQESVQKTTKITTRTTPKFPEQATKEDIIDFVERSETARVHNRLLRSDTEAISIDCDATGSTETRDGVLVSVVCNGYADHESTHVDVGNTPVVYFVNDSSLLRIDEPSTFSRSRADVFRANDSSESFVPPFEPASIRIYNFDDDEHEISVTVNYADPNRSRVVLNSTYRISSGVGVVQEGVTARSGSYEVRILVDSNRQNHHVWSISEPETTPVLYVFVSPNGGVTVHTTN